MRIFLLLCSFSICYSQQDGSFWWIKKKRSAKAVENPTAEAIPLSSLVTPPTALYSDVVCCECVPFFLCENGTIISDGSGALDLRIGGEKSTTPAPAQNVEVCPNSIDLCCLVPNVDTSCLNQPFITKRPVVTFTPHPHSECECLPYTSCDPNLVVSDGLGPTSLELSNGRVVTHSKCVHALDVCCFLPELINVTDAINLTPTVASPVPEIADPTCECVLPLLCGPDGYIKTDGASVLDLRIGPYTPPKPCPQNPDLVCCRPPESGAEKTTVSLTKLPTTPLLITSTDATNLISTVAPAVPETADSTCECVLPPLCGPDGYIKTEGAGVLELRIGPSTPPKPCPQNPDLVCCRPPKSGVEKTTEPDKAPSPCGHRNYNGIGVRILGFKEGQTQFGEFPWVATLLQKEFMMGKEVHLFVGGASLIHQRVVMTAAHKIKDIPVKNLLVRLGEWDVASTKESLPYQDVDVEQVIIHSNYTPGPLFHDIALLILKEDAKFDFHINPICPAQSLDDIIPSTCIVNGWGVDAYKSENYQRIMKSVVLPLMGKGKCQDLLRKTRLSRYFNLHNSFICAGGEEGIDACKGDGGGPLACQTKNNPLGYLQVGITAWGIGCGGKDVPGVYVDVAVHYHWITEQVNTHFPEKPGSPTTGIEGSTLTMAEERKLKRQERREERRRVREEKRRQSQERRNGNRRNRNRRNIQD